MNREPGTGNDEQGMMNVECGIRYFNRKAVSDIAFTLLSFLS